MTDDDPITIVVVDDDPMVRAGLALILGSDPDLRIVAEAQNGAEAVITVREHRPQVVLMDIRMPVLDGLAATRDLRGDAEPPAIIMLTTFDTDEMILEALATGAAGFVLKDTPPAQLLTLIRDAAAGLPVLSPTVASSVIAAATSPARTQNGAATQRARDALAELTDRELEVAQAVGRGLSNAEIAADLFMSLPTVKTHVGHALVKLGLENRVQLAILVHDAGSS